MADLPGPDMRLTITRYGTKPLVFWEDFAAEDKVLNGALGCRNGGTKPMVFCVVFDE
jgi:hypothetical protein